MLEEYFLTTIDDIKYILPLCHLDYHSKYGIFEKELIQFCKELNIDKKGLFLDIGAHTGTYSLNLAEFYDEVYSYEPQRMTFYALCGSIAMNKFSNIYPFNFALGSIEQSNNNDNYLNINSKDGGGSSLKNINNILKKELVMVKTLDEISVNFNNKIKFIKVDIEGNEIDFLKGGVNTISKDRPIILIEQNNDYEALTFLKVLNYTIIRTCNNNMFLCHPNL